MQHLSLEKELTHANDWIVLTTLIRSEKQHEYIDPRIDTDTFGLVNTLPGFVISKIHGEESQRQKCFAQPMPTLGFPVVIYGLILFEIESLKELVFR